MALFGVLGYVFVKLDCEPAPLLLGFILGPLMEENLRRAMLLSRGDPIGVRPAADQPRLPDRLGDPAGDRRAARDRKKREEAFVEEPK